MVRMSNFYGFLSRELATAILVYIQFHKKDANCLHNYVDSLHINY